MEQNLLFPDYLFEVSWEACNKVGGIYTVISTKATSLTKDLKDNYILIGPDVWKESASTPEFIEDKFLYKLWRRQAESEGLKFKLGRWDIAGSPVVILVDFTQYFAQKDKIFYEFWEKYQLDSINGQWDYMEPVLFGYASARIIESFYTFTVTAKDKLVAHFHEWMTGSGILYLKQYLPQAGTLFTTHATAMGRAIAGNGLPLYREMENYSPAEIAVNFGLSSKQSMESLSARHADCFTTVSDLTNRECKHFLSKPADLVTPNGFEDSFVPEASLFEEKRKNARRKIITVTEALLNQKIDADSLLIINSGRYEFRNKGIDVFIDSLAMLNQRSDLKKTVVACIMVPANQAGPRSDLLEKIHNSDFLQPITGDYLTHRLHDESMDPVINRLREQKLMNRPEDKVKVLFAPCYLNGTDGIFNLTYYDTLIGFDLSVFPSYYEPWGYTPLESIAFRIPTVTTSLAGFGVWMDKLAPGDPGVKVIDRDDDNHLFVSEEICKSIAEFTKHSEQEVSVIREKAWNLSRTALWPNLVKHYHQAFHVALLKSSERFDLYRSKQLPENLRTTVAEDNPKPAWKKVFIKTFIPETLFPIQRIARNLWWSWNNDASELFSMMDPERWEELNHNPIALLESLSYEEYLELEKNSTFVEKLHSVSCALDDYLKNFKHTNPDLIAYFSMEYGLHDSIKIYSGGLGVLAGDYMKEASDSGVNMIGIGLLYRYGYFTQTLSISGEQISNYNPQKFTNIPVQPVRTESGDWVMLSLSFPGRTVYAKVWKVDVGRIPLYLLDSDIPENSESDRTITHQLYGGDWENRLKQEILLGIGGIRLLEILNLNPELYHCNEGHAAFIGLERLRKLVENRHLNFHEALEVVRSSTLFTTHTPVPAGHDAFSEDMMRTYLSYFTDRLGISWETFIGLGRDNAGDSTEKFSMSVLACRLSQEINGVSRVHGNVSRKMFNSLWDGYFPQELHIGYVTNGVHMPTWTAPQWMNLYRESLPQGFLADQSNKDHWAKIWDVPDEKIWAVRQELRQQLFIAIRKRLMENIEKRQENPTLVLETIDNLNESALTIGFARRFATYKRAHLLFRNIRRLSELVNNPERPIQFIFAGKAHPADKAGQDLIKRIVEISRKPEFIGKILFLENYDMDLAKKLVQGVDVWLNNPTRPLEASGTSGEKAIMNGVVNCSVLDGWWAEGYVQGAGWALKEERTYHNQDFQDELDAETLYFLFESEIAPAFYNRRDGIPTKWISHVKKTIAEITPRFTMKRMIDDYYTKYYNRMLPRRKMLRENNYEYARKIAAWKQKIIRGWESIEVVSLDVPDSTAKPMLLGETFNASMVLKLNEIKPSDIGIEIVFGQKVLDEVKEILFIEEMKCLEENNGTVKFSCSVPAKRSGVYDYSFRLFPKNPDLPHRMDFPLVRWI